MVGLRDESFPSRDSETDLVDTELPSLKWVIVSMGFLAGHIELESGVVKTQWLTDGSNIRVLQRQDNREPFKNSIFVGISSYLLQFFRSQLGSCDQTASRTTYTQTHLVRETIDVCV